MSYKSAILTKAILISICLISIRETQAADGKILNGVAYFGDSQTAEGGIGDNLKCMSHDRIIGFHSAGAAVYARKTADDCLLPAAYQKESPDNYVMKTLTIQGKTSERQLVRCDAALKRFQAVLALDNKTVNTIVVALGDNHSKAKDFRLLLSEIKAAGKKCVWVMPSMKVQEDFEAEKSIQEDMEIAIEYCGQQAIINPSRNPGQMDVKYETVSDHKHYVKTEGAKIAKIICDQLPLALSQNAKSPTGSSAKPIR